MSDVLDMSDTEQMVTMTVAGHPCGISVAAVRDVLDGQSISPIPLAPPAIAGSINLRGRIVTVLDVKIILGLGKTKDIERAMNVVIEHGNEMYSLLVDQVGDVLSIEKDRIEPLPRTVAPTWKSVSAGIVKLKDQLVFMLVPDALLARTTSAVGTGG